jgi:hypothetical protein
MEQTPEGYKEFLTIFLKVEILRLAMEILRQLRQWEEMEG